LYILFYKEEQIFYFPLPSEGACWFAGAVSDYIGHFVGSPE
jgi:hypothetical protein